MDERDSLFPDGGREEAKPREPVKVRQKETRRSSYHILAESGQTAVLVDGTKFLENRYRLVHSCDLWWIDSPAQNLLGETRMRTSSVATTCEAANLDVLVFTCRLYGQTDALQRDA